MTRSALWLSFSLIVTAVITAEEIPVDLAGYAPACGIAVKSDAGMLDVAWRLDKENTHHGRLTLDLRPGHALIARLGTSADAAAADEPVLRDAEPAVYVTVGLRGAPPGRPPDMPVWNVFFDTPSSRPHRTHVSSLQLKKVRVTSLERRATISVSELSAGPFAGELQITLYNECPLLHVEAVVSTQEEKRAIVYDAGLTCAGKQLGATMAWLDTEGRLQRAPADANAPDKPIAVRHRALIAESERGSVACFPPPHQFFYPVDFTDNRQFVWFGKDHRGLGAPFGFGIRQDTKNRNNFVPWFNAPPGASHRLGLFYLLSRGKAEDALKAVLRLTNGDRFPVLPGHVTFASHWHMAIAVTAMGQKTQPPPVPEFVRMFKEMGVNAVHLAEFHGDGHQKDPGPLRLPELEAMFAECKRLSDGELLLIPGEEVNDFLGIKEPGKHPGHWMSLFPKPVYWTMQRAAEQPFAEPHPKHGTHYRVASRADMMELLKRENGLAWVAHPRIKASSWTPDIFRNEDFFKADYYLGAAWKAMPADLSRERLGERCLDLLSDMANWGERKYMPGEVDVFKLDHTHELYGHMNINYLKLPKLPRYDDGWQPVLDALRAGRFFVTTGEVLISEFSIGGKESGQTLELKAGQKPAVRATLQWTFPLKFAELISGDGKKVYRERIDLSDTPAFGSRELILTPDLSGRTWARFEAWDVAANGAFTQPVWIGPDGR